MTHKSRGKHIEPTERTARPTAYGKSQVLELVLKCDVAGTVEAIRTSIHYINVPGVEIKIIKEGVGPVSKSDLLMAQTGSKLVVGFNVGVASKLETQVAESGVEVRLYDVIYKLSRDIEKICQSLVNRESTETIVGNAKIIATFKAGKGMIIGCEVTHGTVALGKDYRIITAMGPAYTGKIDSLEIEKKAAKIGKAGQQVGIHIPDWKKAKIGDLIECFETPPPKDNAVWHPQSRIFR
jgi:translation initiation factor IF-2